MYLCLPALALQEPARWVEGDHLPGADIVVYWGPLKGAIERRMQERSEVRVHGAAGKSTLLDILSLRKTSGKITGKVRRGATRGRGLGRQFWLTSSCSAHQGSHQIASHLTLGQQHAA